MPVRREGARFIATVPEGYELADMALGPDNRIYLVTPDMPPVYLDETTRTWVVVPFTSSPDPRSSRP